MRLPRWMLIFMQAASASAVLFVACWWWVTWPERTFKQFVALVLETQFDEANEMLCNTQVTPRVMQHWQHDVFGNDTEFVRRSPADIAFGRATFQARTQHFTEQFIAERGRIIFVTPEESP